MLMAIQALTQFVIHYWTVDYGGNDKIVNQVGFAGTIVSIALAVVAIVYAYFQTAAQKRDADVIANRLAEMRQLLSSLNTSGAQLGNYAKFIEETQSRLEEITTTQGQTLATAVRIEKSIDEKRAADVTSSQLSRKAPISDADAELAKKIVEFSAPLMLLCFYALSEVSKRSGTSIQYRNVLRLGSEKTLGRQGREERYILILSNWIEGIGAGTFYMLQVLRLASLTEPRNHPEFNVIAHRVVLSAAFAGQMDRALERLAGYSEEDRRSISIDREGIESAIKDTFGE
jgi:hypothetical protein